MLEVADTPPILLKKANVQFKMATALLFLTFDAQCGCPVPLQLPVYWTNRVQPCFCGLWVLPCAPLLSHIKQ